jgi:hypothetical protein
MEETPVQICAQCRAEKPLTTEFYGVKADSKTGYRAVCRVCFNTNRSAKQTREEKALKNHERIVKAARAKLAHPEALSVGELHKLENLVRLADKHQAKLAAKVDKQRKADEHAKKIVATSPSLDRIRAQFYCNPFAQSHPDLTEMVAEMKAALSTLAGPADEMARDYLTKLIGMVEEFVIDQAAAAKEKAENEQAIRDGQACQDAADAIQDKFAGLFGEGGSTASKDRLKSLFQLVREEAQQQHKTIKPGELTATGANRKKISSRILEELTAIASRLGKAGTEFGPQQSLENVQSLEWHSATSAQSMRAYVRQLTAKLEEARATMTPEEYKKKYLELPVAPKEEIIVWRVRLLNGREEWIWPSGKIVRRGVDVGTSEIIKDARLGWTMAPSPAGAELDDENKPVGKMELVQIDDCSWRWIPEGSQGTYTQQSDGTWLKDAGSDSPWSTPEPITFKVGPAQPDAAHSEFRSGYWFTPAECDAVEQAPDLKEPPQILEPLTRTKADSIAVEPPPTAEEIAKWSREPNRWKRHEQKQQQERNAEQALLRGVFVWDKNQTATN